MRSTEEVTKRRVGVMLERMRWSMRMQAEMGMRTSRCSTVSEIGCIFRIEIRVESANNAGAIVHARAHWEASQLARSSEIRPQTHGGKLLQSAFFRPFVLEPHLYTTAQNQMLTE